MEYIVVMAKWSAAILAGWWMQVPSAFHALLALMALDLVTGFTVACANKQISAQLMGQGIVRKMLTLIVLLTCHITERAAGVEFHIETIGCIFYCINEVISIIENAAKAGVPIPEQIVSTLLTAKKLKGIKRAPRSELDELDDKV